MITHWDEVATTRRERGHVAGTWSSLTGAGSVTTGVNRIRVDAGCWSTPLHLEGSEEEIFVVLEGDGTLERWPRPRPAKAPEPPPDELERQPIRAGSVIASPPGRGRPLALRAGAGGCRVLAYGTRDTGDVVYYPRSGKVSLRGVGLIGRIELVDYWDGED